MGDEFKNGAVGWLRQKIGNTGGGALRTTRSTKGKQGASRVTLRTDHTDVFHRCKNLYAVTRKAFHTKTIVKGENRRNEKASPLKLYSSLVPIL